MAKSFQKIKSVIFFIILFTMLLGCNEKEKAWERISIVGDFKFDTADISPLELNIENKITYKEIKKDLNILDKKYDQLQCGKIYMDKELQYTYVKWYSFKPQELGILDTIEDISVYCLGVSHRNDTGINLIGAELYKSKKDGLVGIFINHERNFKQFLVIGKDSIKTSSLYTIFSNAPSIPGAVYIDPETHDTIVLPNEEKIMQEILEHR